MRACTLAHTTKSVDNLVGVGNRTQTRQYRGCSGPAIRNPPPLYRCSLRNCAAIPQDAPLVPVKRVTQFPVGFGGWLLGSSLNQAFPTSSAVLFESERARHGVLQIREGVGKTKRDVWYQKCFLRTTCALTSVSIRAAGRADAAMVHIQ